MLVCVSKSEVNYRQGVSHVLKLMQSEKANLTATCERLFGFPDCDIFYYLLRVVVFDQSEFFLLYRSG